MAILRSSHKAGQTKPQDKPFKELISGLGRRSQLAAPKYAQAGERTSLGTLDQVRLSFFHTSPSLAELRTLDIRKILNSAEGPKAAVRFTLATNLLPQFQRVAREEQETRRGND